MAVFSCGKKHGNGDSIDRKIITLEHTNKDSPDQVTIVNMDGGEKGSTQRPTVYVYVEDYEGYKKDERLKIVQEMKGTDLHALWL